MTKIGSTNTSRQKKTHEVGEQSAARALFYITEPSRRAGCTTDVSVLSLCLSLYVTVFTDLDRGYLPRCSECSESAWYPPKRGRSSLDACQGHVGGTHWQNPGYGWVHAHLDHHWWRVGRLACGSIFGFYSPCQQVEFRHWRRRDRLVVYRTLTHTQTRTLLHKKPSGSYSLFLRYDKQWIPKKKTRSCPRLSLLVVQIYEHLQLHLKWSSSSTPTQFACLGSFLSFLWIVYFPVETLIWFKTYTSSGRVH